MDNEDRKRSVSFSMRIPADTDIAIREYQQELCHRDKVSYTMNEVALFLLDTQLYKSGRLTSKPALKGRGGRRLTIRALQEENERLTRVLATIKEKSRQRRNING